MRVGLFLIGLVGLSGCGAGGAHTLEEGQARVQKLAEGGATAELYDLVDEQTRWSIDTTFKYQQQSLAVIEEAYPPELQAREKARFVDGDDVRKFLVAYEARYHLLAVAPTRAGDFEKDKRGRWYFIGLRAHWDDVKLRSSHDLDTVKESAAAYRRASH
jgi:hypothetical protein